MQLRKIRSQVLPGVTLCQKDGIGLLGILAQLGEKFVVRQAFVPVRVFAENGNTAATLEGEIMRYGTYAARDSAVAWFPEVAAMPYMDQHELSDWTNEDDEDDDEDELD